MASKKVVERNKRFIFLGVEGAGIATTILVSSWIGVPLILVGGYLGYDWFMYRVKHNIKF